MSRSLFSSVLVLTLLAGVATAQEPNKPQPWFEQDQLDFGRHVEGERASGVFEFRNPTGADQTIDTVVASCSCTSVQVFVGEVRYTVEKIPRPNTIYRWNDGDESGRPRKELVEQIAVPADAEGRVEVEIDLRNVKGQKSAQVTFGVSDPANPALVLRATAFADQFFQVSPPEVRLGQLRWDEAKTFSARITSPIQPEFEVVNMDPLPDGMTATFRKESLNGVDTYVVEGTYGPGVDPNAGGGVIRLRTNVGGRRVEVRVIAYVSGPLSVEPSSFVQFGRIRRAEGKTKTVRITPADEFDLQVEGIEIEDSELGADFLEVKTSKVGGAVEVSIEIKPDAPRSLVRGTIRLRLNHPSSPEQTITFNGFVR